jgi:cytochrome c oxidase accessory protein FixG
MSGTSSSPHDLDRNTLSMLDEFGHRKTIIPAEIKGFWNRRKSIIQTILLFIFLALPWIKIGGHQAVLLDLPGRHFVFFGLEFFAHDAPVLFLILFSFFISILLITALWGRIWCGWACPQTVFIERVYRKLETWIVGDYIRRRKIRDQGPNFNEQLRIIAKWVAFLIVSSLFSHSFIAYWVGATPLLRMIQAGPDQHQVYFILVSGMTALLLYNFGWFREQFCIIACPYGRFQSTLVDTHSINVMYDEVRGEPRRGVPLTNNEKAGDCVSCRRCIQVCPTGIDIRNGVQMECIGCTACMDACDEIMVKVNKPKGLIRYKALTKKTIQWWRPRVIVYSGALFVALTILILFLLNHSSLRIEMLRAKDLPFSVEQKDQQEIVRNHFILRLENKSSDREEVQIRALNDHKIVLPENPIIIEPNQKRDLPVFFESRSDQFDIYGKTYVEIEMLGRDEKQKLKAPLLGPFKDL